MFNKYEYRQYDTIISITSYQYDKGTTILKNDTLMTVKCTSYNSAMGMHQNECIDITDRIGMTKWSVNTDASCCFGSRYFSLIKYCGKDFTAITGVKKNVVNAPKTPKTSHLKFYKTISCNNKNQGVTLLGRTGAWENGSFGIVIQKRNTN